MCLHKDKTQQHGLAGGAANSPTARSGVPTPGGVSARGAVRRDRTRA